MFFTQEDYRKIEKWLLANSRKDTDFVEAATPLKGNETVVLVQDGKNVKTSVKDIVDQFFLLGVSDFLNITDKYGESYISLTQAIQLIPFRSRKEGQVITFIDESGNWAIYQFQGKAINQWNNTTLWIDLLAKISGIPIIDSEDITTKENSTQVSLYLADKQYNEADYSGLGRIYLRKNIQTVIDPSTRAVINVNLLTQSMLAKENTIYIIQYDYNLNKQTISIPEGSVLLFEGGSIDNGAINCNSTTIVDKFSGNATIVGTYSFQDAQADEEDITQNQSSVLKFKDRNYEPDKYSGLGMVILRKNIVEIDDPIYGKVTKNILFQDMIAQSNTIYEIRYDYNLNGNTVTIPEGCILDMRGGSVTNGTINCVDTIIISTDDSKLDVTLTGTYRFDSEKLVTSNTEDINISQSVDRKSHTISAMLADRDTTNGMGYVILRKGQSFASQLTQQNTIYVIRYDFTLTGNVTVPANCILEFDGGSISGTDYITFQNTLICGTPNINISCSGIVKNIEVYQDWFYSIDYFLNFISSVTGFEIVNFKNGIYYPTNKLNIQVDKAITINGNGAEIIYNNYIDNNPYWKITSKDEVILTQTLPSIINKGDTEISVSDISKFSVGDVISIIDNTAASFAKGSLNNEVYRNYREGEFAVIANISNNKLVLSHPTYASYKHVGDCTISKLNIVDVTISDIKVKLDYVLNDVSAKGLFVYYANIYTNKTEISGFMDNFSICYCTGGTILDCKSIAYPIKPIGMDNYALTIANCENIKISGGVFKAGNHGVAIGGYYSGPSVVINRNIIVENTVCHSFGSMFGIDCHGNSQYITFRNNVSNGIVAGGSCITIEDNNLETGCIQMTSLADFSHRIIGNRTNHIYVVLNNDEIGSESNCFPHTTKENFIIENNNLEIDFGGYVVPISNNHLNFVTCNGYDNADNVNIVFGNNLVHSPNKNIFLSGTYGNKGSVMVINNIFEKTRLVVSGKTAKISDNVFNGTSFENDNVRVAFSIILNIEITNNLFKDLKREGSSSYLFGISVQDTTVDGAKLIVANNRFIEAIGSMATFLAIGLQQSSVSAEDRKAIFYVENNIIEGYGNPYIRIQGADKIYLGNNALISTRNDTVNSSDCFDFTGTNEIKNYGNIVLTS